MKNSGKLTTINIPTLLKKEIEYYLNKTKRFKDFEDFLDFHLNHGLYDEILQSMKKEKKSNRCGDMNPKTVRRVYKILDEKEEFFICDEHKKESAFDKYESEESIQWGDWKNTSKSLE